MCIHLYDYNSFHMLMKCLKLEAVFVLYNCTFFMYTFFGQVNFWQAKNITCKMVLLTQRKSQQNLQYLLSQITAMTLIP